MCWFHEVCRGKSIPREFSGSPRVRKACVMPNITLFWFQHLQVPFPNSYKDAGLLWTSPSHWRAFSFHCTEGNWCPTCWPEPLRGSSCADHGLMRQKPRTQCTCSPKITTSSHLHRRTCQPLAVTVREKVGRCMVGSWVGFSQPPAEGSAPIPEQMSALGSPPFSPGNRALVLSATSVKCIS